MDIDPSHTATDLTHETVVPVTHAARLIEPRTLGLVIVSILAFSLIFVAKEYHLFQATMLLAYAVALLGLNILTGYNGQLSLGHGAFFAMGAYTLAILVEHASLAYWLALPCTALVCLAIGYLFGRPALKLEGHYLALATFGLALAVPQLLKHKFLAPWTGGVQGIVLVKPEAPWDLPLNPDQWLYLFTLVVAGAMFFIAHNLLQSGTGRAMRAIRDQPVAAVAMGIDTGHYKSMTFAVSAAYTGVGGALSGLAVQFVAPDSFPLFLSISLLVGAVVGGIGTLWGALFGAAFIMFVPAIASSISKSAPWAIYAVVLIALMFVMPSGAMGLLAKLRETAPVRRILESGRQHPSSGS